MAAWATYPVVVCPEAWAAVLDPHLPPSRPRHHRLIGQAIPMALWTVLRNIGHPPWWLPRKSLLIMRPTTPTNSTGPCLILRYKWFIPCNRIMKIDTRWVGPRCLVWARIRCVPPVAIAARVEITDGWVVLWGANMDGEILRPRHRVGQLPRVNMVVFPWIDPPKDRPRPLCHLLLWDRLITEWLRWLHNSRITIPFTGDSIQAVEAIPIPRESTHVNRACPPMEIHRFTARDRAPCPRLNNSNFSFKCSSNRNRCN